MTALICEKRRASASERTLYSLKDFIMQNEKEQKTLRRETRGIRGSGGSGRFRYRRSIGVFVYVFIPARETRYFKPAEQKPARAAATG